MIYQEIHKKLNALLPVQIGTDIYWELIEALASPQEERVKIYTTDFRGNRVEALSYLA